jgi:hypothetical protein
VVQSAAPGGRFAELDDSDEEQPTALRVAHDPRAPRPVEAVKVPTWVRQESQVRQSDGPGTEGMNAPWCQGSGGRFGEKSLAGRDWADTDSDEE